MMATHFVSATANWNHVMVRSKLSQLGIPAEDYDIQDNFGQTDHVTDLLAEIETAYGGG